jgi:hypothetical protein
MLSTPWQSKGFFEPAFCELDGKVVEVRSTNCRGLTSSLKLLAPTKPPNVSKPMYSGALQFVAPAFSGASDYSLG